MTTALVSAALTFTGTAVGFWLIKERVDAARTNGDRAAFLALRKVHLSLFAGGGSWVVLMLSVAGLTKLGHFPSDLLVAGLLDTMMWLTPTILGLRLLMLVNGR